MSLQKDDFRNTFLVSLTIFSTFFHFIFIISPRSQCKKRTQLLGKAIAVSLFTYFASLAYASHYLMKLGPVYMEVGDPR